MTRWFKEAACLVVVFASAAVIFPVVPTLADSLNLDASAEHVQLGLFLGLWAPALLLASQGLGILERGVGPFLVGLAGFELLALSALFSAWLLVGLLCVLTAFLWWLTRRLGMRPGRRAP